VSRETNVRLIVVPPTPMLGLVAQSVRIETFAQSVSFSVGDKTTGAVLPEAVKAAGASGTLLNHSEARMTQRKMEVMIPRLAKLGLRTCLCAQNAAEVERLAKFGTEYLAVEPPSLIGSGVAVSKAKPELVQRSVQLARKAGYAGKILCGAGIVDGEDVSRAIELGVDGVLVASSVVRASDWAKKLTELSRSMI